MNKHRNPSLAMAQSQICFVDLGRFATKSQIKVQIDAEDPDLQVQYQLIDVFSW